jgi:hypothetical protein
MAAGGQIAMMKLLVVGAMLLLVASYIYPPLGRAMRNFGRGLEAGRSGQRRRPQITASEAEAPPAAAIGVSEHPQFGKKKIIEEPKRPAVPPSGQIFNKELFEGETGEFLREFGYAPDDPRNQAANVQPLSVLLAEDLAGMRRATEAVNKVAKTYRIEPWHLLPLELWRGDFGEWLRQHLDLSPCRPWNTIFLPADQVGAKALGLPVAPPQSDVLSEETMAVLAIIRETYAGLNPPEGKAMKIMLAGVRSNTPQLFPPDIGDFSERVRDARADVRALAFGSAVTGGAIDKAAILKSQDTFLGKPEQQLVS